MLHNSGSGFLISTGYVLALCIFYLFFNMFRSYNFSIFVNNGYKLTFGAKTKWIKKRKITECKQNVFL